LVGPQTWERYVGQFTINCETRRHWWGKRSAAAGLYFPGQ